MPVHHADEELWLRHIKIELPSFTLHEFGRLITSPCALCFIEHNDFLDRDCIVSDILVSEVMDILDEAPDLSLCRLLRDTIACRFVTCKRLSQNINKWTIAG